MNNNLARNFFFLFILITMAGKGQPTDRKPATLNHTAIYVMDVKASTAFYKDVIGLDTVPEPFHDGKHAWFRIAQGITLHIIQGANEKKEYFKNQHTCFSVSSVSDFTETLRRKNISWEDREGKKMSVTTRVDGIKQLWLQDPDGYWIEINDAKE